MSAPNYQASDFLSVIHALMPRGLAWPKSATAVMSQVMSGLSPTWQRHTEQNNNLLIDAFPATSVQLLPEWEAALGLPDPCAGESPTLQGRQAQVVARFAGSGGQSVPYFVQYAQTLGYAITITEFVPFRAGQSRAGASCGVVGWAFTWQVNSALNTITYFRASLSAAGEPLASWGNTVLQCEINEIKPAHTLVNFAFQ